MLPQHPVALQLQRREAIRLARVAARPSISAARANRPARVAAGMAADEEIVADEPAF
jgi:hypothetical protein